MSDNTSKESILTREKIERAIKLIRNRSSQEIEEDIMWWRVWSGAVWLIGCPDLAEEGKDAALHLIRTSEGYFKYKDWDAWYKKYYPYTVTTEKKVT